MIINADDFGLSESCTKAIAEAFNLSLISDTTMVANGNAYDIALGLLHNSEVPNDRVGIHFNLTEGKPVTDKICHSTFFCENGRFHGKVNRMKPLNKIEQNAVYEELTAQLCRLKEDGIAVTHADSHHHIHTVPYILPIVLRVCQEQGINRIRPYRNIGEISWYKMIAKKHYNQKLCRRGFHTVDYFGSVEDLKNGKTGKLIGSLEIMVHPDYNVEGKLIDRKEKQNGKPAGRLLADETNLYMESTTISCYKNL